MANLITMPDEKFFDITESNGIRTKYCFYLTGPLGVGKSTAISSLGSLNTFDEWVEPRLEVLAKPWTQLSAAERRRADSWIIRQFKLKNDNVRKKRAGLFVLDRGPLDPLAFTRKNGWSKKASTLLSSICPKPSKWSVEPGCVVLLVGDHNELSLRLRLSSRNRYTSELLKRMQDDLEIAYGKDNVVHVDTTGLSPAAVVNKIAELVHLGDYREMRLHRRLTHITRRGL